MTEAEERVADEEHLLALALGIVALLGVAWVVSRIEQRLENLLWWRP